MQSFIEQTCNNGKKLINVLYADVGPRPDIIK